VFPPSLAAIDSMMFAKTTSVLLLLVLALASSVVMADDKTASSQAPLRTMSAHLPFSALSLIFHSSMTICSLCFSFFPSFEFRSFRGSAKRIVFLDTAQGLSSSRCSFPLFLCRFVSLLFLEVRRFAALFLFFSCSSFHIYPFFSSSLLI
jgi:hypothetical protein